MDTNIGMMGPLLKGYGQFKGRHCHEGTFWITDCLWIRWGGYVLSHGQLGALWQPFELIIIGGAAVGAPSFSPIPSPC